MARIVFASSIQRHVSAPEQEIEAATLGAALAAIFAANPKLATYVVDDQGHLRKHVTIFLDGRRIADPVKFTDPLRRESEVFVVQALSGG